MRVDPYPISGPGTVEVTASAVHITGNRGIPWQVEVGGLLGLVVGVVVSVLLLKPLGMTFTLIGIMIFIAAGSALGYRLAGNRIRARHEATFEPGSIVEVGTAKGEVQITISFRKRWQTRKQCVHFRPDDAGHINELRAAVEQLLVRKAA